MIYHTKYCEICDLIVYPDLSEYNLINIHTRHIITYNFYLLILNLIFNSSCFIEIVIEHLIQLRTKSDGKQIYELLLGLVKRNEGNDK